VSIIDPRKENTVREPNFDERLEPKYRRRTPEEVEEIVREQYEDFLKSLQWNELFIRVPANRVGEAYDAIVSIVTDVDEAGKKDKEFRDGLDWSEIEEEVS
jgi:hypothetical protein